MAGTVGGEDLARTVRAAQAGDGRAFEDLVNRFREPLGAFAFGLLRDRGLAEDVVQSAFLLAYRGLGALRDPGAIRPWLYSIVENLALTGRRRRKRRTFRLLEDRDAVAEGEGPPRRGEGWRRRFPAPAAHGDEEPVPPPVRPEVRAVREGLARIAPNYAQVLTLHYLEGLTASEIARALGLTRNNAKVRLFRARNALRRDLLARNEAPAGARGGRP